MIPQHMARQSPGSSPARESPQGNNHMPQQSPGGALCRSQLNGPGEEALGGSHARGADDEHHGRCGIRPGVGPSRLCWQTAAPGPSVGRGLCRQSASGTGVVHDPSLQSASGPSVGHDPSLHSGPGPGVGHGLYWQRAAPGPGVDHVLCWQSSPRLGGDHGVSGKTMARSRWEGTRAPPLVPGRQAEASDSSGAYGGVAAHEAAKLRSREAQRKVRQRHKVRHVCGVTLGGLWGGGNTFFSIH